MRALMVLSLAVVLGSTLVRAQREGDKQWGFTVQGYITLSSPALSADGTVVFVGVRTNTAGRVLAITTLDGRIRWSRTLTELVDSSPAVSGDGTAVYVGCANGILYALRASDGSTLWERRLGP